MAQKVIKGNTRLSEMIRSRRKELGLTIEEAASRANVGIKTWCRYEAGESIRKDKAKGICKALNWSTIPDENDESSVGFDIEEYRNHEAWSEYISECYGEAAAISFVIGSDILLDQIEEDLRELSTMPKGSHIGQLSVSMMKDSLPEQFLMEYDYDFLYYLKTCIQRMRLIAHYNNDIIAHSVIQEIIFYLVVEEAAFMMDFLVDEMMECEIDDADEWDEWIYDLFGDMDVITCLYSNNYLTPDHIYHFIHWKEDVFYCE